MNTRRIIQSGKLWKVPLDPTIPVVPTSPGERAIGRLLKATLTRSPESDAEVDLVGDAFFTLYRRNPGTVENPPPSRAINKMMVDWTLNTPEFMDAKASATSNLVVSMASAGMLWSSLTSSEALKEALEAQREAEQEEEFADDLDKTADRLDEEADQAAENGYEENEREARVKAAAMREQAKRERANAQATAQQGVDRMAKLMKNPLAQGMVTDAVQKAGKKAKDVEDFMKGWGIEPGSLSLEGAQDVLDLVEQTNKTMQQLAELIGRLKGIATSTSERVKAGYVGSISEPTLTNDITRIFPTERAYLSHAAPAYMRAKSIARMFAGGGVLGWQPKFQGKKKGSFVAMIDRSGSMSGDDMRTAKAVGLGIARALAEDNSLTERMYRMTYFQSLVDRDLSVSNEDGWDKHIAWAKVGSSGGTDFDHALKYAIEIVHEFKERGVSGADILFITDGECEVSPDTAQAVLDLREEVGTRLIVVLIGSGGYYYGYGSSLANLASMVIKTSNLKDDAASLVAQITENIVRADMG